MNEVSTIPLSVLARVTLMDYRRVCIVLAVRAERVLKMRLTAKDIVFAKVLKYDRGFDFDWLNAVAGGNIDKVEAVNEVARDEFIAELEGEE